MDYERIQIQEEKMCLILEFPKDKKAEEVIIKAIDSILKFQLNEQIRQLSDEAVIRL